MDDEKKRKAEGADPTPTPSVPYRATPPDACPSLAPFWSATRLDVLAVLKSKPFVVLLLLWAGGAFIETLQTFQSAELGTALVPTTSLLLDELSSSLSLFGMLLVVYYAAELVWRERVARISEVVDATPAASGVFFASKAAALGIVVLVLMAAGMAFGALFQLANGSRPIELSLYLSLFYFVGLPLLFLVVLALLVQTLAPNRHVGMLLTLLAMIVFHRGGLGGPQHPLFRYAPAPPVAHSDIAGFSPSAVSFTWFMAYGAAVAAVVAVVVLGLWRRGTETSSRSSEQAPPRRWSAFSSSVRRTSVIPTRRPRLESPGGRHTKGSTARWRLLRSRASLTSQRTSTSSRRAGAIGCGAGTGSRTERRAR